MVTVILTVFKRACNLEKQINALLSQTIPPTDFIININDTKDRNIYDPIIKKLIPNALIVEHSKNLGVWSRFFFDSMQIQIMFLLLMMIIYQVING